MKRKICVVSGTRAEYGLLRWIIQGISESPDLELQLIATGMHLSAEFGLTYQAVEADGFRIDRKVDMLLSSNSAVGIAKSVGVGMIGFADALADLQPDVLLVLGDRFEIIPAVICALVASIPVAHLHGGELTEGAFDESIRHAITKMAHLHFVAAEEYRRRVVQLGEQPNRVFLVGGPGIDNIKRLELLSRDQLQDAIGVTFRKRNLLITFHPVTLDTADPGEQMQELLAAVADLADTTLILTMPNADTGSRVIRDMIQDFVRVHPNAYVFDSLGQLRYLSCLKQVDAVVGNSSSGLTEAPSFKKGTINIGDRQKGRLQAQTVINCRPTRASISSAIITLYSDEFQCGLADARNPYGDGGASERVVDVLRSVDLKDITKKKFADLLIEKSPG
jgi:GDP/UDP-N,N'-diacetylbacillosamine 2-epimerase (hydrolysing)